MSTNFFQVNPPGANFKTEKVSTKYAVKFVDRCVKKGLADQMENTDTGWTSYLEKIAKYIFRKLNSISEFFFHTCNMSDILTEIKVVIILNW